MKQTEKKPQRRTYFICLFHQYMGWYGMAQQHIKTISCHLKPAAQGGILTQEVNDS